MDYTVFLVKSVLIIGTHLAPSKGQQDDITLEEGAYGQEVVESVIGKLLQKSIYSDNLFLSRLAHVQSLNGTDPMTYRPGYHGGIWQIDFEMFSSTKDCQSPAVNNYCKLISKNLLIDWSNVTWYDLRKPLYSGLAALLYSLLKLNGTVMSDDVQQQNAFCVEVFDVQLDTAADRTLSENNRTTKLPIDHIRKTSTISFRDNIHPGLVAPQFRSRRSPSRLVRLTDGGHAGQGRIEVFYNGVWGTVCSDLFDIKAAVVVCRMLGYTSDTPRIPRSLYFGEGRGNIWLDDVKCRGNESNIFDCSHKGLGVHNCQHSKDAAVICQPSSSNHDTVRLVNSMRAWSGRVEVKVNGSWGTVCNVDFDVEDARVICRMLGYTEIQPEVKSAYDYDRGQGSIFLNNLKCTGTELNIFRCPHSGVGNNTCGHYQDVGVNCQPALLSSPVRLMDGVYPWEGRVEVWHNGTWHSVCDNEFDGSEGRVICSMLGYNSYTPAVLSNAHYGQATGGIWPSKVQCYGRERSIFQCHQSGLDGNYCRHSKDVGINCYPTAPAVTVRLKNGLYPWVGQVEVWYEYTWMPVCSQNFGLGDARVVCHMLGFLRGQPSVYRTKGEYIARTTFWKDSFNCLGTERSLFQCSLRDGNHTCDHRDLTAVNCLPDAPTPSLRLAWGVNRWEGQLEIWYNGSWEPVCPDNFEVNDTQRVCGILGYTGGSLSSEDNKTISLNDIKCKGSHHSLMFCRHSNPGVTSCSNNSTVFINCNIFSIDRLNPKNSDRQAVPNEYEYTYELPVPGTIARAPTFPSELAEAQMTNQTDDRLYINTPDDVEMHDYENDIVKKYRHRRTRTSEFNRK